MIDRTHAGIELRDGSVALEWPKKVGVKAGVDAWIEIETRHLDAKEGRVAVPVLAI